MLGLIRKINEQNKEKQQPPLSIVAHDKASRGSYMQRPILSFPFVESNYFINAICLFLASTIIANDRIKQFKSTLFSNFCSTHRFTK